jgi:hypothetical protein
MDAFQKGSAGGGLRRSIRFGKRAGDTAEEEHAENAQIYLGNSHTISYAIFCGNATAFPAAVYRFTWDAPA